MIRASATAAPLLLCALLVTACASGAVRTSEPEARRERERFSAETSALDAALRDPALRGSLRLVAECRRTERMETVELFGNGHGVWEGRRQFEVGPETVEHAVELLETAGFTGFEPLYGELEEEGWSEREVAEPPHRGSAKPPVVVCRIALRIAGLDKQVVQVDRGERFEPLARLAGDLLDLASAAAVVGIEATGLDDGLERIGRGELVAETWSALLQILPEGNPGAAPTVGSWLEIDGLDATARPVGPQGELGPPRRARLDRDEVAALAAALALEHPDTMPANLWAERYTSVSLRVLDRSRSLLARQFARMTPSSAGDAQVRFERVVERLTALHERILAEGIPLDPR